MQFTRTHVGGEGGSNVQPASPFPLGGGEGGGVPTTASPFRGSDLSPELVRARFNSTQDPTRITIVNDNTANGAATLQSLGYATINADRPIILIPIDNINDMGVGSNRFTGTTPANAQIGGLVRYGPNRAAPVGNALGPNTLDFTNFFNGDAFGVCYLSNPGTWYIYFDFVQPGLITSLSMLVVDASDSGTVAKYLGTPGCSAASRPSHAPNRGWVAATAVSAILLPANDDRTSLIIQNTGVDSATATVPIRSVRIALGTTAINNGGILLSPGGSLTLDGKSCWKGRVETILDIAAVGSPIDVIAQEFF